MNTKTLTRLLLALSVLVAAQAHAVRSVVWDKSAIRINLVVGVEQMIHFPDDGQVGLPGSLANPDIFTTLFAGKTAYWTALQPFASERIKVRLNSGEFILFDVSAVVEKTPPAGIEALNVVVATSNSDAGNVDVGQGGAATATIFDVIRYAAQMTYSPARLVEPVPGIREVPLGIMGNLNRLYNHENHKGLVFAPLKSWTVEGLYVTAVSVVNTHIHEMVLDNRLVQHTRQASRHGVEQHFIASSFFNKRLAPGGEAGDKTTLFIVTKQPFASAIRL